MFERFTKPARDAVAAGAKMAVDENSERVEGMHLLRALIATGPVAHAAIAGLGADPDAVALEARRRCVEPASPAGLSADEVDALRAMGVDVEVMLSRLQEDLGVQALSSRKPQRRPWRFGGGAPFSLTARKTMELALRHALRFNDRELTDAHLLVGLVRADPPARALLAKHGVTEVRLLEWLGRRPDADGGAMPVTA